jgi:hypothetical protein
MPACCATEKVVLLNDRTLLDAGPKTLELQVMGLLSRIHQALVSVL